MKHMRYLKSPWLIKESSLNPSKIELIDILTHCGDILQDLEHDTINSDTHGLNIIKSHNSFRFPLQNGKPYKNVEIMIVIKRKNSDSHFTWDDISFYIEDLKSYLDSNGFSMTYWKDPSPCWKAYNTYADPINSDEVKENIPLSEIHFKFNGIVS